MGNNRNEYMKEYRKIYNKTQMGRATTLLRGYKQKDKLHNRGKSDLTPKWIVENIFTKPCAHCGKIGWDVIGCNRLDDSKPHTKNNVEPCCKECNDKLNYERFKKQVYQYTLNGELVRVWQSTQDAAKTLHFNEGCIATCCRGGFFDKKKNKWINIKQHKGYKWSYIPS